MICLALIISQPSMISYAQEIDTNTITVTGCGQITKAPDSAIISICVTTTNPDLATATEDNKAEVTNVMQYLTDNNISTTDINTDNYYTMQQYDINSNFELVGYKITNCFDVTANDISNISNILTNLTTETNACISGIRFELSDRDSAYNEALSLALQNATSKAQSLANATLQVKSIKEHSFAQAHECMILKTNNNVIQPSQIKISACVEVEFYTNQNVTLANDTNNIEEQNKETQDYSLNNDNNLDITTSPTDNDEILEDTPFISEPNTQTHDYDDNDSQNEEDFYSNDINQTEQTPNINTKLYNPNVNNDIDTNNDTNSSNDIYTDINNGNAEANNNQDTNFITPNNNQLMLAR